MQSDIAERPNLVCPSWHTMTDWEAFLRRNCEIRSCGGSLKASVSLSLREKERSSSRCIYSCLLAFARPGSGRPVFHRARAHTLAQGRGLRNSANPGASLSEDGKTYLVTGGLLLSVGPKEHGVLCVALHLHHDVISVGFFFGAAGTQNHLKHTAYTPAQSGLLIFIFTQTHNIEHSVSSGSSRHQA